MTKKRKIGLVIGARNCERRKNSASCYSNYDHDSSDLAADREYHQHCRADNDSARDYCRGNHGDHHYRASDHNHRDLFADRNYHNYNNRANHSIRHNCSADNDIDYCNHHGYCSDRAISRSEKRRLHLR